MRHQHRRLGAGRYRGIKARNPIGKIGPVPIGLFDRARPRPQFRLPQTLPMLRAGIAEARHNQDGVHQRSLLNGAGA